ncbi:hypothetical protein Sjap_023272 [Stephania japonica]|uniref:Uncharacterized protein n=1 Tax=Stephania japonica TaxID=461633 RepID=A0AAP0EDF6_9MAGN
MPRLTINEDDAHNCPINLLKSFAPNHANSEVVNANIYCTWFLLIQQWMCLCSFMLCLSGGTVVLSSDIFNLFYVDFFLVSEKRSVTHLVDRILLSCKIVFNQLHLV